MKFKNNIEVQAGLKDSSGSIGSSSQVLSSNGTNVTWVNLSFLGGSGTLNYVAKFTSGTTIGNSQIFDNGTNVGIGTTAPSKKLDVSGSISISKNAEYIYGKTSSGSNVRLLGINAGDVAYVGAIDSGPVSTIFNASSTSNTATFYTAGSERIRIDSNGNVGIGTTAPNAKLDVNGNTIITGSAQITGSLGVTGSISTSGNINFISSGYLYSNTGQIIAGKDAAGTYINAGTNSSTPANMFIGRMNTTTIFQTDGGNERMRISSGGNVGIGTASPTQKLDVVGKIALNDGGNSVFIGTSAGLNDDATDNRNVGIGHQSLSFNTTGNNNTATGYYSLRSNTTGANNTANGYASLQNNTTGYNNTANGYESLYLNTTGYNNTANGLNSLRYNTTGNHNSSHGFYSLWFNTTGNNNTSVGAYSLFLNTTGLANVAVGMYSLSSNSTGNYNTGYGYFSLASNTTGYRNIAIGNDSGRYIADGTTANTITNNSVYLGYNTKALADNQTNQIVIGYEATGLGSNTVVLGNDSIVTTALKGYVNNTKATTQQNAFVTTDNYAGDVISGTVDGSVSQWDLVSLDYTSDTWYQADNATVSYTYMLGIYLGGGLVLLEGHVTVHDEAVAGNGPSVRAPGNGLPIYAKDGTAALMSTIIPTTSGNYVRILGHTYRKESGTDNYIMKFRPSNDWIQL